MRIKRRKRYLGGWAVVTPDGEPLVTGPDGNPVVYHVPELAVAEGNRLFPGQDWAVRRLA